MLTVERNLLRFGGYVREGDRVAVRDTDPPFAIQGMALRRTSDYTMVVRWDSGEEREETIGRLGCIVSIRDAE